MFIMLILIVFYAFYFVFFLILFSQPQSPAIVNPHIFVYLHTAVLLKSQKVGRANPFRPFLLLIVPRGYFNPLQLTYFTRSF